MAAQFYDNGPMNGQWTTDHNEWSNPYAPVYNYYNYANPVSNGSQAPIQAGTNNSQPATAVGQTGQFNQYSVGWQQQTSNQSHGHHAMYQMPMPVSQVSQVPQVSQVSQVPQVQQLPQVQVPQPQQMPPVQVPPVQIQQPQQMPQGQSVQPVQPVQPQYGYYYPYAYAPRMQPTSLPSPTLEGTFEEYDEQAMVEFLSINAYSIMSNGHNMWTDAQNESFQRFVQGVLRSTRLSKHTILLSLCYLTHRWTLGDFPDPRECDYDMHYLMFVVALALANKVHDDNTFTNSSWCQATGIPAAQITRAEASWLKTLNWDFDIRSTAHWHQWHDRYQSFLQQRIRAPLTPPGLWVPPYESAVAAF